MTAYSNLANCSICRRTPGSGNGSCPFKDTWQPEKAKLERHDCGSFKPISNKALDKRLTTPVDQVGLF